MIELTAARLRELLHYEPETGQLYWRVSPNRKIRPGQRAGSATGQGYTRVVFGGRGYLVHRLIWLHVHGHWPAGEIDHINRDGTDNRLSNLRDADRALNNQNRRGWSRRSSPGVRSVGGSWQARIQVNGERILIGSYETAEAANSAYSEAKSKLHAGCSI